MRIEGPNAEEIVREMNRLKRRYPLKDWRAWEIMGENSRGTKKDACMLIAMELMMEE